MKHTFKKIAATISAAVMCALPMANALSANAIASSTARYTYRKLYYTSYTANVDHFVYGIVVRKSGTSVPASHQIYQNGTLEVGGSAGTLYYNAGGNFYPNTSTVSGIIASMHCYSDTADFHEYSSSASAFDANGNLISGGMAYTPSFLVGDIDSDGDIDYSDYTILQDLGKSNVSYSNIYTRVYSHNNTSYPAYKADINNDGRVNNWDAFFVQQYLHGMIQKFTM